MTKKKKITIMKKRIETYSPSIDKTKNISVNKIQYTRKSSFTEMFKDIEDDKAILNQKHMFTIFCRKHVKQMGSLSIKIRVT